MRTTLVRIASMRRSSTCCAFVNNGPLAGSAGSVAWRAKPVRRTDPANISNHLWRLADFIACERREAFGVRRLVAAFVAGRLVGERGRVQRPTHCGRATL